MLIFKGDITFSTLVEILEHFNKSFNFVRQYILMVLQISMSIVGKMGMTKTKNQMKCSQYLN